MAPTILRGQAILPATGVAVLLAVPAGDALAQPEFGGTAAESEAADGGWDGQVAVSATHNERPREGVSDYNRSGVSAMARVGFDLGALPGTVLRVEGRAETDKFTTGYGGTAEVRQQLGDAVTFSLSASAAKNAVVLEADQADQTAVRAGVAVQTGKTRVELFARHRWRDYGDAAGRTGKGWQAGASVRQRFGSYHWIEAQVARDRIDDGGGRRGYRRTSLAVDYSHPVAKRLRAVLGAEYRSWVYDGRRVADLAVNPVRRDRLVRPDAGLAWGRARGLYARATAGYDFYRSNDPRYSGDGPRLRATVGFRF